MAARKSTIPVWIRRPRHTAIWSYRQATSRGRRLPAFIVIGAQKCGTSSLFAYLAQHPLLIPAFKKEVHYFDGGNNPACDDFLRGPSWYRAHFPLERNLAHEAMTFEATPRYLFDPLAPRRIHELVPQAKLIVLMRDPTERAISHYFHSVRQSLESEPIRHALKGEEARLEKVIETGQYKSRAFIHHSYKARGLYKQQIERFLPYFGFERMLFLSSEALFSTPAAVMEETFRFVGVDPKAAVNDLSPRNVTANRKPVDQDIYRYLGDYFRPHNEELYAMIGKRFDWDST